MSLTRQYVQILANLISIIIHSGTESPKAAQNMKAFLNSAETCSSEGFGIGDYKSEVKNAKNKMAHAICRSSTLIKFLDLPEY